MFSANDLESATLGQNISPAAFDRMTTLFVEQINAAGGIGGCPVELTVRGRLRHPVPPPVREALQSDDFDVFLGPTNSACMFGLPALTGAAGNPLIAGIAADHQPSSATARSASSRAATTSCTRPSRRSSKDGPPRLRGPERLERLGIVPNYAYGQDVAKCFKQYFAEQVPDGEIIDEQFPEFDEDNFTPFINPMARDPDGVLTAFFGSFLLPFLKQWKAGGEDVDIPVISGLATVASPSEPHESRPTRTATTAATGLLEETPVGAGHRLGRDARGRGPLRDSFAFQVLALWR